MHYNNALFEDQIGKFDWFAKHIGCFRQTFFKLTKTGKEILIAATDKNVISRIDINTGELIWRQINEKNTRYNIEYVVKDSKIITMINNGEYFRSFDIDSGILKWQVMPGINSKTLTKFTSNHKILAVLSNSKVYGFLGKNKIVSKWITNIDQDCNWLQIKINHENLIFVFGVLKNNKQLRVLRIDYKTGGIIKVDDMNFNNFINFNRCILLKQNFVCSLDNLIILINFNKKLIRKEIKIDSVITKLHLLNYSNTHFVVQTNNNLFLYEISDNEQLNMILKLDQSNNFAITKKTDTYLDENMNLKKNTYFLFSSFDESKRLLNVFNLSKLKEKIFLSHFIIKLKTLNNTIIENSIEKNPFVNSIQLINNEKNNYAVFKILTTRQDCRVELYKSKINLTSFEIKNENDNRLKESGTIKWIRFEALASISAVEMVDLPLSDAQARIETEFRVHNEPIWNTFFLRVNSQLEQLQQSFIVLSNRFITSLSLLTSSQDSSSLLTAIQHLFGYNLKQNKKQRAATVFTKIKNKKKKLERDYFNLKKMIVVSTLNGLLYGLNNDNGEVIWSLYLGIDALPFYTELKKPKIPIFIQRGTTLFQYQSQAVTIINLKHSENTKLIHFNPITGSLIKLIHYEKLINVELLPFHNSESIYPLILINQKQKIDFFPKLEEKFRSLFPIYLTNFNNKNGKIKGFLVKFDDQLKPKLIEVWQSRLDFLSNDEKIVSALAKPINQKVHSQGKVLGNRSVLYKYANPNLIAIATINIKHSLLGIWLLDGVTGQIVYSGRHPHSSEPINLVHCENWIVYTYWNDKARRTELGIIELYEGLEQTNKKNFNSYTTLKSSLNVFSQSYVFLQGVSAIAASETEQGLSTRSLIIAMPFGGVLEISRRFVDARRPLELTSDLREEIEIPYMPELPVATEDLITYNQTIHNVHGIKTCASGLESTSLIFVYGLDLFYTRVTPSGTFDILKDDFDYILISLVMITLIVASILSKRLWRYSSLKQAWN